MICVDASVAAKWILNEVFSPEANALLAAHVQAGQAVSAPPFLPIEVTNILRQRMVRRGLSLEEAHGLIRQFLTTPVTLVTPEGLYERALEIAEAHGLPAAYDAHYVAVAQLLEATLWTDDRRLLRALGGRLPYVKWIGDYSSPAPRAPQTAAVP